MLEVRGRTPATPSQKIPLLYPEALEAPLRSRAHSLISELREREGKKPEKRHWIRMVGTCYQNDGGGWGSVNTLLSGGEEGGSKTPDFMLLLLIHGPLDLVYT